MAERRTKEVLLRLRRAREVELRREVWIRRAERSELRRKTAEAEGVRRGVERELAKVEGRRAALWSNPRPAGRVTLNEGFERSLRAELSRARMQERRTTEELDRVEAVLSAARRALGEAVLARQRSESLARTELAEDARVRERREQVEVEDRFRLPSRPRR